MALVNNIDSLARYSLNRNDAEAIPLNIQDTKAALYASLRKKPEATLILDSELKLRVDSRYQSLEGLRLAYECRTNPELRFRGFIKLFGFLALRRLKENKFGGLVRGGERIHEKEFALKGVGYYLYPTVDCSEAPALTEVEWSEVVEELDEIFVQEFRRFEHGFRNVTLIRGMDSRVKGEKTEELQSHLRTLRQIECATVIKPVYRNQFESVKQNLQEFIDGFSSGNERSLFEHFKALKSEVSQFRDILVEREVKG